MNEPITLSTSGWAHDARVALSKLDDTSQVDFVAGKLGWPLPFAGYPRAGEAASWGWPEWEQFAAKLGFGPKEESKHQFIYRHKCGLIIGHAKTPGDFRSSMASMTQNRVSARTAGRLWLQVAREELAAAGADADEQQFWSTKLPEAIAARLAARTETVTTEYAETDISLARQIAGTLRRESGAGLRAALVQAGIEASKADIYAMLMADDVTTTRVPPELLDVLKEALLFFRQQERAGQQVKEQQRAAREAERQREHDARRKLLEEEAARRARPEVVFAEQLRTLQTQIAGAVTQLQNLTYPALPPLVDPEVAKLRTEIALGTAALNALQADRDAKVAEIEQLKNDLGACHRDLHAANEMVNGAAQATALRTHFDALLKAVDAVDDRSGFMTWAAQVAEVKRLAAVAHAAC